MYVVKAETEPERYETVDTIADGAMGTVYLARDRLMDRLVAIKTVRPRSGDGAVERHRLREALLREARLVQLLAHRNIVKVHEVLESTPDRPPSLVMEYVQGTTLEAFLKGGKALPADFAVSVATQISEALEHAHSMGVVHGDIKPANILIGEDQETVKVTDFGIARLIDDETPREQRIFGTPRYVAPERLLGQRGDRRADLFSLGVVLFEMLTGRSPFTGKSASEIAQQIARGVVDFSAPDLRDLPEHLVNALRRALERDPAARFQTARELAAGLRESDGGSDHDAATTQDLTELVVPQLSDIEAELVVPELPEEVPEPVIPELSQGEGEPVAGGSSEPTSPPESPSLRSAEAAPAPQGRRVAHRASSSPGQSRPWLRPLAIAATTLVAAGAAALVAIHFVAPSGPIDARFSRDHHRRIELLPLLREGHRLLASGEPEVAARVFARAEELAPERLRIADLRYRSEQQVDQLATDHAESEWLEALIRQSRAALDVGNSERAFRLATDALAIAPDSAEARALAEAAQAPAERAPSTQPPPATPPPTRSPSSTPKTTIVRLPPPNQPATEPAPRPSVGEAEASDTPLLRPPQRPDPPPPARTTDLRIDVFSHLPKGVLTVYRDNEQILLKPFRFVEKSGFLRRRKTAGRLETAVQVPAGAAELRIYVASEGQETQTVNLATDLSAGETQVLRLVIAADGSTSARMN